MEQSVGSTVGAEGSLTRSVVPSMEERVANVVAEMCARRSAIFIRQPLATGRVRVALETAVGDRLAAEGADTEAAVQALHAREEAWPL